MTEGVSVKYMAANRVMYTAKSNNRVGIFVEVVNRGALGWERGRLLAEGSEEGWLLQQATKSHRYRYGHKKSRSCPLRSIGQRRGMCAATSDGVIDTTVGNGVVWLRGLLGSQEGVADTSGKGATGYSNTTRGLQ